jgi:1-deoxy-D-xylulose-5-phosphate reductoisomerase
MMKKVYLLGATGSIGLQTIDIIRSNPLDFCLAGVTGYNNFDSLVEIIDEFKPEVVAIKSQDQALILERRYKDIKVFYGNIGLDLFAAYNQEESIILINALVGMVGLRPTIEAIRVNRDVLLANKETLVVGGHLINDSLKVSKAKLYPIDSEHNGVWQLLKDEDISKVKRVIITASGGAFRDKTRDELTNVSLVEALNHPNWQMGKKITIDSATLMNKGFEIIEAAYLFDIEIDKIEAIIHKESIVHAMVEFNDGSIIAQMAEHDMRIPIAYALNFPLRKQSVSKRLDLKRLNNLHFEDIDIKRYPCLSYAIDAYKTGGSMRTVLNAANEAAVSLFLEGKIKFLDIEQLIRLSMDKHVVIDYPNLEEIYQIDELVKTQIFEHYKELLI